MLKAEQVTYKYIGAKEPAIINAEVTCSEGTINLLWGDNGAGKSTLALILCGAIPHLIKGTFSGNVFWNRAPLSEDLIPTLSSFVFQNPYTFFQGYTIQEELSLSGNLNDKLAEAARTLLPNVPPETPLHALSLGQQERVAICSGILRPTPLLFLDEPFESLDDSGVEQTVWLINDAVARGRIVILIQRPQQRRVFLNCHKGYEVSDGRIRESLPGAPSPLPSMIKPTPGAPCIVLENLSFTYKRTTEFSIREINLSISEGEVVGLIGPNGSGKTTLFLLMSGLLNHTGGRIFIAGETVKGKPLRRLVKCAFQNPENQIFGNTVEEELEFGLLKLDLDKADLRGRVERIAEYLPFDISVDPFSLSYGQKKILTITATFLIEPKVILLDEPTAGLDLKNILIFKKLAEKFIEAGGSLLISSHNLPEIESFAHRVLAMKDGRLADEHK
jgi:energy-coupling factor transporter ATP-binding protein EcfA2